MKNTIKSGFSKRLIELRKEENLTQRDLGTILNYGSTAISNYEQGRTEPSIDDLKKISKHFNVSLDYLVGITDIRNPYIENASSELTAKIQNNCTDLNKSNLTVILELSKILYAEQIKNNVLEKNTKLKVAQNVVPYKTSSDK